MHSRAAARAVRMTRRATSRVRENMATEVGSGWRSKINDAERGEDSVVEGLRKSGPEPIKLWKQ
uniref:Uncharacterized protein n=1 Tax=Pristionchus pacificus TaxID=54126 RepID=A0A2A6BQD5_PRIPA|eukprot:PDM67993.1 hypothetical protein PRIPAC_46037 [Pristionchus pacificus]